MTHREPENVGDRVRVYYHREITGGMIRRTWYA
jgi:hypothetical protein